MKSQYRKYIFESECPLLCQKKSRNTKFGSNHFCPENTRPNIASFYELRADSQKQYLQETELSGRIVCSGGFSRFLLSLLVILLLVFASTGQAYADEQEIVTIISGTVGPDIIIINNLEPIAATAEIETELSEKVEATATGIDSLEGSDTIIVNAPITTAVASNALLLQTPDTKTESIATSTGISAGEGDDSVDNNSGINVFGSSLSAYGSALQFEQPDPPGSSGGLTNKKEIEVSVSSKTELTGVATGDGSDSIENDGLLIINGLATSGGLAGDLTATIKESSTLKSKSVSEVSATGIQAGGGGDTITNDGAFITTATATSGALAVGLVAPGETTPASDKKANIKTESNAISKATVVGIHGDDDETTSSSDDSSPIGVNGLRVTYEKSTTTTSGDDTIINNGFLTGNSTAISGAGAGSISNKVNGSVQTNAKSEAEATVTGINAGGGHDVIINTGELLSTATATSGALTVAVEIGAPDSTAPPPAVTDPPTPSKDKESKSSTDASSTAQATATGITADGDARVETSSWSVALDDGSLVIDFQKIINYLVGNDTVTNRFAIQAFSTATSLTDSVGVTVSSGGSAESKANAEAESYGASIVTGSGDDQITNRGLLTTESTANATAVSLGLAVGQPSEPTTDEEPPTPTTLDKLTSKSETNVTAKARGYGIDAEGLAENVTTAGSLSIGLSGLDFSLLRTRELGSGNDTISNVFGITVNSSASASSTAASIQIDAVGSVDSEAKATSEAQAVGIATGAGEDNIVNSGLLLVDAIASADSISFGLSVSKPPEGETTSNDGITKQDKTNVKTDASATASATAVGIDAEDKNHLRTAAAGLQISGSGLNAQFVQEKESLAGNDTVTNTGIMTTTAGAISGAISAGISINAEGSVDAEASSKATASSSGILTGGGADTVNNQAFLSSNSNATATALAVSVSAAQPTDSTGEKPTLWEKIKEKFASANSKANAEATSNAVGIDTEGDAGRQVDSIIVDISSDGLLVNIDREFTSSAGDDTVTNSGALTATSSAMTLSGAADVQINTEGTASSETKATAKAEAGGVLTGGGADEVTNSGALIATADATAGSVAVSFTQPDGQAVQSKANSKAVAEAKATGIATDDGRESELLDSNLSIGPGGIDFSWHAEEIASAEADTVTNTGAIVVSALTLSGAGGAAVSLDGSAKTDVTAKSTSNAVAVDTGGGGDFIDNEGYLIATGSAISGALAVSYGQKTEEKTKPKVEVKVGATSESSAVGIRGDSGADKLTDITVAINSSGLFTTYLREQTAAVGNDTIVNRGRIDTLSISNTGGLGVSVAIDGAAKADVNATSKSEATSIEAGGGNDLITSTGDITATADSTAVALAVAVGKKTDENSSAKTKVEAKTLAEATATGIAGDGGLEDTSRSVLVNIDDNGLLVEYADQKTAAAGDDEIVNSGTVTSGATATSGAVSVAVTIDGAARADANSAATAKATGLDSGAGSDLIDNSGALQVDAAAISSTLNVAVSSDGRVVTNAGLMDGGNKAEASAVGINSGGGEYQKSTTVTGFIDFNAIGVDARYEAVTDSLSGDGVDTITNSGSITASSFSLAPEVTAGITGEGLAVSIGRTQAEATASAIKAGNLGDNIDNSGDLIVNATSTAVLANVAVTGKGLAVATNAVWDGGTKTEATANGIDADSGSMTTKVVTAKANKDIAFVRYNDDYQAASGDDRVTNSGLIDAAAFALAPSLNVAIDLGQENKTGIAAAVSTSSADAKTFAIRGGDGNDDLQNSGLLNVTADATALSANVAVVNKGVAAAADAVWDGGTKAEATAVGIAGDGGDRTRSTYLAIGTDEFKFEKNTVAADGADNINNTGEINSAATANAASIGVAVAAKGVGVATSTATAESRAAAIDAGSEASVDEVYNSGKLNATSAARAAAASVSVTNEGLAVSADSVWDGGTKATAVARGIDVGAGGETLTNDGQIDASADAIAASASIAVSMKGVAGASATATGKADAIAIDASAGDDVDTVTNNGTLTVDAAALSAAASVSVTNEGLAIASGAVWDGGTGAESIARGIDVGDGGDVIDNTGAVTVSSLSAAAEAAVGVAVKGVAGAVATSTSESTAVALHAGDDDDIAVDRVINSGALTANADAGAVSAAVSFSNQGIAIAGGAVWDGGTHATADARGMELGAGADVVDNSGDISANSISLVAELAASVSVSGVAGAVATSTGDSSATAIHTGSGNAVDSVNNSGNLSATANAAAATAAISVTNAGLAVAGGSVWDGGTKGSSQARGIYVGSGLEGVGDSIDNRGDISATSTGIAAEVAAAISVSGVAGATATSTGSSLAAAIDASEGNDADTVINSGSLRAESTAAAATSTVTFTNAGLAVAAGAVWDGGTKAISDGYGIAVGAGQDGVANSGNVTAIANAAAAELGVSVAVTGVAGAIATSTGTSSATAIDTGEEEEDADTVINSGDLTAESNALAATATVSVTTAGVAVAGGAAWAGGTTANAQARGIEVGEGADIVDNSGNINIWSNSVAAEAAVAVAVSGVAAGVATATSNADASAIDTGSGSAVDVVINSGDLDVTSHALAATTSVSVTTAGVAVAAGDVWDGGTEAHSGARGIEVGEGADTIENSGSVQTDAWAESASATISVAVAGVAGAISTATAEAESTAIEAGAGNYDDVIINEGDVGADATAIAASAAVSFTAAGVAISGGVAWDGGTTAESDAKAMNLGGGADAVYSDGVITADAVATSTDIVASIAIAGVAGAITAANSHAAVTGIDTGAGADVVETYNLISVASVSNSNTVANADSKFGVTVAGNNSWDGGTRSGSTASGINSGTGVDRIDNYADIVSTATSVPTASALTFVVGGVGVANSTATADARANAVDAGSENDRINNLGDLNATATAAAVASNVALTGIGVGIAADAVWDGGTTSISDTRGIDGGDGDDVILTGTADDTSVINATANSTSVSTSLAVTVGGVAGAISTSTANADASGIYAGTGNDTVVNNSAVTGLANANAASTSVALTGVGVAVASDSFWDGGTKTNAYATSLSGGAGNDEIQNLNFARAEAESDATSVAAAVAVGGIAGAAASATATADAVTLSGDVGDDTVINEGIVEAAADATATGVSVTFTGVGVGVAGTFFEGGTTSDSVATGLGGGIGEDQLVNIVGATIDVQSHARTSDASVSVTLQGIAGAGSRATAISDGYGIAGGDDADVILNEGTITQATSADAVARSISFAGAGAAISSAGSIGHSQGTGLAGGADDDTVTNTGQIDLSSTAEAIGQSVAVTYSVGGSVAEANADAIAEATGISGNDGTDGLTNTGNLTVRTDAKTTARAIGAAIGAGIALGKANSTSEVVLTGMSGGDGDDTIVNSDSGEIFAASKATADAGSVAITLGGVADAEARSIIMADASGLSGGSGDDAILNAGILGVQSHSLSTANSASVSFVGVTGAKAGTEVETRAVGISGGDGVDNIVNTGSIRVGTADGATGDESYMAVLRGAAASIGLAGLGSAEASAFASTEATGLAGGAEDDIISNQGDVTVLARSLNQTGALAIQIFGSSEAAGESGAFTLGTGLAGGGGHDYIETLALLYVETESELLHNGASLTFAGDSGAESSLEARTEAIGLNGDDGDDGILTKGAIVVEATSTMISSNGASAEFGSSSVAGQAGAATRATAIDGGDGNDIIDSAAEITLTALSDLALYGSSFALGGSSASAGQLAATTQAEALVGGDGDDQVANRGVITITARSEMTSSGEAETGFGSSDANNVSGAVTRATGMLGGEGDDLVENSTDAEILVDASTRVDADAMTYTFAGGTSAGNLLTGLSYADGITGGQGNDQLFNNGSLNVSATAELTARGGSKSTFTGGSSSATGTSAAGAEAVGMNGGEGDDMVMSAGDIEVRAESVARANNNSSSTASFTSDQIAGSISETTATATGLRGEGGNDTLVNEANLTVLADSTAYSFAYANGATISFDGDAEASSTSSATATATGFSAEDGDVVVYNEGQLTVTATAGTAEDLVSSLIFYRLQGDYEEDATTFETAIAETVKIEPDWTDPAVQAQYAAGDILYCTDAACVQNPVVNSAGNHYRVVVEQVDHDNNPDTAPIDAYSWTGFDVVNDLPDLTDPAVNAQYVDGEIVACTSLSCREAPSIESSATYWKVVVTQEGDPPVAVYSWVPQNGLAIEVSVEITETSFPTYAAANANGLDGDGVARATGVTTASAYGIQLGNGQNTVVSRDMNIKAIANTLINSASDGDVFGDSRGSVDARATAKAFGIVLGDGNDYILNSGTMAVTATPIAQGYTAVSPGGGICIWFFGWWCAGEGTPDARANATFTAEASGIQAGNGNNFITNDKSIIITAAPDVAEDLRRPDYGEYAVVTRGDDSPVRTVTSHSTAIGILTGDGNDTVINNGNIIVEAKDIFSGCADGTCGIPADAQVTLSSSGIVTGAGDDTVKNSGAIIANLVQAGVRTGGVAISTGGGNDTITLSDAVEVVHPETDETLTVSVVGDVDFGAGDDTLHLIGSPIVQGNVLLGMVDDGVDSLIVEGAGFYGNSLVGFENATKQGTGVYRVPILPTMRLLEVKEGTFEAGGNYTFASDGLFRTIVNSDGSYGKLHLIGSTELAGSLSVLRDSSGPYIDATRYAIIEADGGVNQTFSAVSLPTATPLLSFLLNQYSALVEVEVQAESFATVATNRLELTLAGYMDTWVQTATGDLRAALGEFQTLSSAEFHQAFLGFSPSQHDSLTLATFDTTQQLTKTLLQRIHSVRLLGETTSSNRQAYFSSGDKPILLAFNGPADSIGQLYPSETRDKAEFGLWLESFGQWGNQDEDSGFVGYDYDVYGAAIGFDRLLRDRYLLGISLGYSNTNVDLDQGQGDGDIDTIYGSLYGSFFTKKGYLDSVLAYGRQGYNSQRNIVIGSIQQTARGDYDGDFYSAFAEGGLNFDRNPWVIQPYVNLQYIYLEEDGFTEEGAGGLSQRVESRETKSLVSELGLRISPNFQLEAGNILPEASLGWKYDFDIDERTIQSSFAGQPNTSFTIKGNDIENSSAVIGAGVTFLGHSGVNPSLKYSGEFREGYNAHSITGELRWEF